MTDQENQMKSTRLVRAVLLLLLVHGPLGAAEPAKPNVVVLIADDLGYADVSCLHNGLVKTPNIDRLAQMGVRFTSGYVTAPLCGPSRAGFFTGQYQQRFGFRDNGGGIPANMTLLPGVLRNAGYHTGFLGKWHSTGPMPHERVCFDETLCSPTSSPFIDYHHPRLARNGKPEASEEYSTDLFAREAEEFIGRNKGKPFSLTVAFNAPHILRVVKNARSIREDYDASVAAGKPIDVPKVPTARPGEAAKFVDQYSGDTARADTVATIAALDQAVGRILDKLKQAELDRKTIIFLFADNGGHPENRSENLPLRDYKWSVFEGGIRVPFLVAYPGVFPGGREFSHPVSTLDIFPTCVSLSGAKAPAKLDGVDLSPYLKSENPDSPHQMLFFSMDGVGAVRSGQWKLVLPPKKSPLLYDLTRDVEEKWDVATEHPEVVKGLEAKWAGWNSEMPTDSRSIQQRTGGKSRSPD